MHAKTLGAYVAVVAVALTAFAGTASATQLTSPMGATYTGSLHAATEEGSSVHIGGFLSCAGTLASNVEQHGGGAAVKGSITVLSFTGCSNGISVKTLKNGAIEIHSIGNGNGTVTLSGLEVELLAPNMIRCTYSTGNHAGTLTGSSLTGGTAVFDVAVTLVKTGGSFLCPPGGATLTGKYRFSTPDSLLVDP